MNRKIFSRAIKLYLKAIANPFTIGFAILFSGAMLAVFIFDPDPVGSEDYMTMLATIQMGKIGIFFLVMIGSLKIHQNKVYASCCCAKAIYTVAPIVTSLAVSMIYDISLAIAAAINLGSTGLADVIVVNSIGSALLIFVAACYGKKKLSWGFAIPYILFIFFPAVGKSEILYEILGLSVGSSAAIAISVYVISVVLSLVIVNAWWKKSDKFTMPNKFVTNAMGGQ